MFDINTVLQYFVYFVCPNALDLGFRIFHWMSQFVELIFEVVDIFLET